MVDRFEILAAVFEQAFQRGPPAGSAPDQCVGQIPTHETPDHAGAGLHAQRYENA